MGRYVNLWGLVVAGIGFFLTRFTVTLVLYEDPVRFVLAGVVPLALGLGLAAFGVALAVADVEASLVRTTAAWCVVGTAGMLVLVVLTLLGSTPPDGSYIEAIRTRTYLSNFLIGGSIGGTLTGLYAARNRHQRERLRRQATRLEVLNRLLRHEVLNSLTVIRGYASIGDDGGADAEAAIDEHAASIEHTIEDVKYLTDASGPQEGPLERVRVGDVVDRAVESTERRYPDVDIEASVDVEGLAVRADARLAYALEQLLENAVVHDDADRPEVAVTATPRGRRVEIAIQDGGPGLPETQRRLLETGEIEPFDDPGTGFGLNVVRLLVESFDGSVETTVDDAGSTVSILLRRADTDETAIDDHGTGVGVRPAGSHLLVTLGAALVAGGVYGLVAEQLGGSVAFIGVYYGVRDPLVGWLTHEFHSAVFGFVFAGLVSLAPARYRNHVPAYVAVGVGWGVVLWFVAAGLVSPIWLRLLGIDLPIPSLSPVLLATHVTWGATLGLLTAWGYEHVSPALAAFGTDLDWPSWT